MCVAVRDARGFTDNHAPDRLTLHTLRPEMILAGIFIFIFESVYVLVFNKDGKRILVEVFVFLTHEKLVSM